VKRSLRRKVHCRVDAIVDGIFDPDEKNADADLIAFIRRHYLPTLTLKGLASDIEHHTLNFLPFMWKISQYLGRFWQEQRLVD
jgi:hypothetical protein